MSKLKSPQPPLRGAMQHKVSAEDKRRRWLQHHQEVAKDCLRQLLGSPVSTFMTVLVLAVALALPSFLFTSLSNITKLTDSWESENKISLYLKLELTESEIDSFVQRLLLRNDLVAIDLIDSEQGLLEFKEFSGFSQVLDSLSENPLPAVISVLAKDNSEAGLATLQQQLLAMAPVDEALLDLGWLKRFKGFLLVIQRVVITLSILLAFAVLLIIGNTIRLNVENSRDEILVSKLMGATNAWVRRPFLYTGIFYGVVATAVAWLIIELALMTMQTPVLQLAQLYQTRFQLTGLGALGSCILLIIGVSLGWLAALLSVNKFLNKLEPK
ncbi:MAG: permease-like cell division protein FtsX [Oceanospirillaceae bacterium]